jgi:hypothetical protein
MFEAICIRRTADSGTPLDVGLLIEALIFYQKAHVVADPGTLELLISGPGPGFLLELIDRDVLTLSYLENMPGSLKSDGPAGEPRSAPFKKWLKEKDPNADLLREYCREVSRLDWADKLPTKTLRWLVFTAIGLAAGPLGAVVGTAIGATDTFLIDRLLKGWKPNQFVEGPLRRFLQAPEDKP